MADVFVGGDDDETVRPNLPYLEPVACQRRLHVSLSMKVGTSGLQKVHRVAGLI